MAGAFSCFPPMPDLCQVLARQVRPELDPPGMPRDSGHRQVWVGIRGCGGHTKEEGLLLVRM